MKQLGILPILLLLGVGITSGLAAAELTASQSVPSLAAVGETVQVTVMLTYNGGNATQVVVTPGLPSGVVTDIPGGQAAELYSGSPTAISYPIRAVQSGTYTIISQIAYAEDGTQRELLLEAPFTAEGESYWEHTGQAKSNESPVTWFIAGTPSNWQASPMVVVVLVEEDNVNLAQRIGKELIVDAMSP